MVNRLWMNDDKLILTGEDRADAVQAIIRHHYTHSVPSGKSIYVRYEDAIVCWAIPANKNISRFLLGNDANVWELSRLWAPDGHRLNLLTQAIKYAVSVIQRLEHPEAVVSYADPNVGHHGGVYRAASWCFLGRCEESRAYRGPDGAIVARRAFHSSGRCMVKAEIEAAGFTELKLPGKLRFAKGMTRAARRAVLAKQRLLLVAQ